MKIKFTDLTYADMMYADIDSPEFEIQHISWEIENNDKPYDIAICATEETLIKISEFAFIGWNMRSLDDRLYREYICRAKANGATHEALYAQLRPFVIEGRTKHSVQEIGEV